MHVFYRITTIPSTNPSPLYQEDKDKLNWVCLKSFVEAYRQISPKVTFLCDYCPPDYEDKIKKICPFESNFIFSEAGPYKTCFTQFELARELDVSESVLFQECDYLYQPNTGKLMSDAVEELGMVSPYDHLNFYLDHNLHSDTPRITLVDNYHFRTTERHTSTYAVRGDVYKEGFDIFYKYGHISDNNWRELMFLGYYLWVPIPSIATHMVKEWMAPGVDWKEIWNQYQS